MVGTVDATRAPAAEDATRRALLYKGSRPASRKAAKRDLSAQDYEALGAALVRIESLNARVARLDRERLEVVHDGRVAGYDIRTMRALVAGGSAVLTADFVEQALKARPRSYTDALRKVVYFAVNESGLFKVGTTCDLQRRMVLLRNQYRQNLQVWMVIDGGAATEAEAHLALRKYQYSGDWFYAAQQSIEIAGNLFASWGGVASPYPAGA